MSKRRIVLALLRVYPKDWRHEYGSELAGLLFRRPLTLPALCDVLVQGVRQRIRMVAPWKITGTALFVWTVFWIGWNSLAPLSPAGYATFTRIENDLASFVLAGTSCRTYLRGERNTRNAAAAAVRTALLGIVPELILIALIVLKVLPQIVIDIHGSPYPDIRGIALLHTRGPVGAPLFGVGASLALFPLVLGVQGWILGYLGAWTGRGILALRARICG